MMKIEYKYGKKNIEAEVIYSDRKTIDLRVFPEGNIQITVPGNTLMEKVIEKVKPKSKWILQQQRTFELFRPFAKERLYIPGETHRYLGRQYKLVINKTEQNKTDINLGKGLFTITTIINKFKAAVNQEPEGFSSSEIFVLIDEGHRSQYKTFNVKMQKTFPNGCFIAFTGTPLMKSEKNTADKFGGVIDEYTIKDAVEDGAVVPLLYEGRHNSITVNEKPLDNFFDKVSEPLTKYGKAELKRKYSSKNAINKADQVVYDRAWDISEHFVGFIQNTGFKAQLVAPNKTTAILYRKYLNEIGKVSSEVIISAPDTRENYDDAFEENENLVQSFYKSMMDKYGTQEKYEKSIINAFKYQENPEIIIVVDKLLTGFDAPKNRVLYLTRSLKEHTLLQAIARVNRLAEGKDYGLIVDYYGNLENLDKAIESESHIT